VYRDGVLIGQTKGRSFRDRSVVAGLTYSYTVTALDRAGHESAPSNVATVVAGSALASN
jgi:fibronectin type 3 domain-containing protein